MKKIRSIILALTIFGFMVAKAQINPGYLGKKFGVGYHYSGMLTLPVGLGDSKKPTEKIWTFNHFLDAEYVVGRDWSLVGSLGFSSTETILLEWMTSEFDAAFNPNFDPNTASYEYWNAYNQSDYYFQFFQMNTIYLDFGYKRHKRFVAPVGPHSGWKLRLAFSNNKSMDLVTSKGNSFTVPSFRATNVGIVYEFGTTYILWDLMYVDFFGEIGLMFTGIDNAFQIESSSYSREAFNGSPNKALSKIENTFQNSMSKRVFYQNLFNFGIKIGILP